MTLSINLEPIPLLTNADGIVRVGGTRITLDTVVAAFDDGATAEEIVQEYPALNLADVYAVIGYYLKNRAEVEVYLQKRETQAVDIRKQNEARFNPSGIRERLLSRQLNDKDNA